MEFVFYGSRSITNERGISVRHLFCKAPDGRVPRKTYRTPISRANPRILISVMASLFASQAFQNPVLADEPYRHAKKIAELAQPLLDSGAMQGVSIGVIDQELRWIGNFGVLAKDRPQPPSDDTIFEIGFVLNVTASGKRLFLQATGQQQLTLVPQSETKWTIVGVDAMLEFELPQEGRAPAVTLRQNGASPKATRLAE
jgi:hypothetical protein